VDQKSIFEIYGIPETVMRCPGCLTVLNLLNSLSINYKFYPVINQTPSGAVYDKALIVSLAKRAGFKSLAIRYPVIFVDNKRIENIPSFKALLIEKGYDQDLIED
jgi:glutaredoxin